MKRTLVAALIAGVLLPTAALAGQDGYRNGDSDWQRQQAYRDQQYNDRYDRDGRRYYRDNCRRSKGTTGTIAGGVGGAVIGGAIGGDALGAVVGGVGGALLGRTLDKNNDRAQNRRNGC